MKSKCCFPNLKTLLQAATMLFACLLLMVFHGQRSAPVLPEPAGASRSFDRHEITFSRRMTSLESAGLSDEDEQVYDKSPVDDVCLVSRNSPPGEADRDLWIRDAYGRNRFIASGVTAARFSPDGRKIAYSTQKRELVIETVGGQKLAEIPRALDPSWRSDDVISFSAIASLDYPELQECAIYDLKRDSITRVADSKTRN